MGIIVIPPLVLPTSFDPPPTPQNTPDNWEIITGTWGTSAAAVDDGLPAGALATSGQSCIKFFPSVGHNTRIDTGWIAVDTFEYTTGLGRGANRLYEMSLDFNADVAGGSLKVIAWLCGGGTNGRENTISQIGILDTAAKTYTINKWNRISATFKAPAATRWMKFSFSKSDGGWTVWADNLQLNPSPIHIVAHRSTIQSIPNAANTTIAWNVQTSSSGISHNSTTGVMTVEEGGVYSTQATFLLQAIPQSTRTIVYIIANISGTVTTIAKREWSKGEAGSDATTLFATATRLLSAGDTVYVQAYQNSGGALSLLSNSVAANQFAIAKIS